MLNFFFPIELAPTVEDIYRQARIQKDELRNTHLLVPSRRSFVFHFASVFTLSAYRRLCIVSFFFPPTHPPTPDDFVWCHRVSEKSIRHITGFCPLLVGILNKLLSVQKKGIVFYLCPRAYLGNSIIMVCSSEGKYPSGVFEFDRNLLKVLPCSQLTPWNPDLQLHVYPPFLGTHVAPFLQGLLTLHTSN